MPTAAAQGARVDAGRLAAVGEQVGPAEVVRVEVHPEFQRYSLRVGTVDLPPVELVTRPPLRQGVCAAHGLTLFPRWELSGPVPEDPWIEGERDPATDEERAYAALCGRLHERGSEGLLGQPEQVDAGPGAPPPEQRQGVRRPVVQWHWRLLHLPIAAVALLAAALAAVGLRRLDAAGRRDLALVLGSTVASRLLLSPLQLFNGALASWEKVVYGWGLKEVPTLYGDGWAAWMGPWHHLLGLDPRVTLGVNLGVSMVAPLAIWGGLRLAGGPGAARLGGLFAAVLPLLLRLAGTEVMLVPVVSLGALALAAGLRSGAGTAERDPVGAAAGLLAGLAAGLAAHVRPEALAVLPAVAVAPFVTGGRRALGRAGPWLALAAGAPLLLLRWAELPPPSDVAPLQGQRLLEPGFWLHVLLPGFGDAGGGRTLATDPRWTSPLLWLGGVVALARAPRQALPWLLWGLASLPILTKSWPMADAMRLQLLQAPVLAALGGLGLARLVARSRRSALLEAGAVVLVLLPALAWSWRGPALDLGRHHEAAFLLEATPQLPEGTVLFDDVPHRARDMALVLTAVAPGLVFEAASSGPLRDGDLVLRGLTCLEERGEPGPTPGPEGPSTQRGTPPADGCRRVVEACRLEPVSVTRVPARTDLDARLRPEVVDGDGQVEVGYYRLVDCRS